MEEKFYSEDIKSVSCDLDEARSSIQNEVLDVKSDLLSVYLMNLVLYKEMDSEDRKGSPVEEMLSKTSILLEKICAIERRAGSLGEVPQSEENKGSVEEEDPAEEGKRTITDKMKKNKFVKKRKAEDRIPRLKYKNKARKLAEMAEIKHDGNIDTKKPSFNKFD
ncbi:uncharacterized protein Eint_051540 [Encephalitozoon intestinalis ATCC 50506]|uniref:Sas10 C-terminal domain-containing protein n=1 Tax=Encephalitozoon intestinalis (strain ATCC 50506) TaxID=876142 RepID=E0S715_ENCIT|nr:uncharacterized protein Eint_051540 [Encephalitozoon intestinalis ATCC 50506]ADM11601.1 hypothetical protein Eint_051540 [Encephalitozoon intestinalis ATCC 50506]UTX45319.1 hypothetical protein GPK93_05g08660 [Encephalitozoon intestinalis]